MSGYVHMGLPSQKDTACPGYINDGLEEEQNIT